MVKNHERIPWELAAMLIWFAPLLQSQLQKQYYTVPVMKILRW